MFRKILLMDGSMSYQLELFGYKTDDHKPHWTFSANSNLALMENVYMSFLSQSVNIITTNTYHFGSTLDENIPTNKEQKQLNAKLFKETCGKLSMLVKSCQHSFCQIWGSVGTFATMFHDCSEYSGKYMDKPNSYIAAQEYYHEILSLFTTETTIQFIIFETISSGSEARAALEVLERFPSLKAVMSFTCAENGQLRHGEKISTITEELNQCSQIEGIGINCTDPENILPALIELNRYNFRHIVVFPNSGDKSFSQKKNNNKDCFSKDLIMSWVAQGATAIGGCCGVNQEQFNLLKHTLDEINSKFE